MNQILLKLQKQLFAKEQNINEKKVKLEALQKKSREQSSRAIEAVVLSNESTKKNIVAAKDL
ncbi:MAG: hypothetical protein ABJC98_20090 [Bacteroidota bacterium]